MLVVNVEIWNGGRRSDRRNLGRLLLVNLSSLTEQSDYLVVRLGPDGAFSERIVLNHRRASGFWHLIGRALDEADLASVPVPDELRSTVVAMLERITDSGD